MYHGSSNLGILTGKINNSIKEHGFSEDEVRASERALRKLVGCEITATDPMVFDTLFLEPYEEEL